MYGASGDLLAQTQLPHVFEPGQPARANEVNQNFDALADGVDANAARLPPVVVDGNGTEIGQLISIGENVWGLMAINQFGYIVSVDFDDGNLGRGLLVYESADCSGTPYTRTRLVGTVEIYFDPVGAPGLYYVDKTAVPIPNVNVSSLSFETGCESFPPGGPETVWPVSVNDPAVTGVSNASYPIPIRIEPGQ
jgi:hypothetical protein